MKASVKDCKIRHMAIMACAGIFLMSEWSIATVDPPDWAGEPGRVYHLYQFPTDTFAPVPDSSDNPFGQSSATVVLGPYSAGWQDPDPTLDVRESAGEPGHGAWDLGQGPDGSIRITLPIGNAASEPGFTAYQVDLQVNAVGYDVIVTLPSLSVENQRMWDLDITDSLAFFDPLLGVWNNRTWNGTLYHVFEDTITLFIKADPEWGSTIDSIEIYARAEVVEEPLYTALGTPVYYYRHFGIYPRMGLDVDDDWDDVDYYDSDHDGMLNWEEYVAGTDPTNPESVLKIVTLHAETDEPYYLEWIGGTLGPTEPYIVESTICLQTPDWKPIGTRERVDGLNDWTGEVAPVHPKRFFRIIAPRGERP